jgi:hypothetical protein
LQLLVFILKKIEVENQLITELAEAGITGGTILTGTGMATAMLDLDSLPIFGLLRQVIGDQEREASKVMLFVLNDEKADRARSIIKKVVDITQPNTGILFGVPISYVEGLGD